MAIHIKENVANAQLKKSSLQMRTSWGAKNPSNSGSSSGASGEFHNGNFDPWD